MRPECLVQEPTRKTTTKKKDPNKHISTTSIKEETNDASSPEGQGNNGSIMKLPDGLTAEQRELIETLVVYQDQFELPSEEEARKVTEFPMDEGDPEYLAKRFAHITEWTIITVRLIVEFTKRLPGFETLSKEDQITLLKACAVEIILMRSARRYDIETDAVVFGNGLPYTRESYRKAGVGDTADSIFEFSKNMAAMKVDNAEYALLTAIVIFSERPTLVDPKKSRKNSGYLH